MSKLLLVTAHPDDECMFFSPTIVNFRKNGGEVDLICFSTGNFGGIGTIRRVELEKSSKILGIQSLFIIEDPDLQDGPRNIWSPKTILKHLRALNLEKYSEIVTFDDGGVSGHPNHCSLSAASKHLDCKVVRLKSIPLWLKYTGPLIGPLLCELIYKNVIIQQISIRESFDSGYKAMLQHKSQLVWFRHLFLIFSVYMTVNVLVKEE